jgi:hypothetical protein
MTDYHWVYLLDEHFRVNRPEQRTSAGMVPADRTVLCIELSLKDEPLWPRATTIYRLALADLVKMGYDVKEDEVGNTSRASPRRIGLRAELRALIPSSMGCTIRNGDA